MASAKILSKRERQIMDIIYRRGSATTAEVLNEISDPPSYSSIRAPLRLLEEKGPVDHKADGPR
jgi:predicted transcriptional regulator